MLGILVGIVISALFVVNRTALDSGVYINSLSSTFQASWFAILNVLLMNLALSWSFYRNREGLLRNRQVPMMMLLGLGAYLIISFIQSSLTISLGMLGALSIIRFRTPVKEPIDLIYIFFSILIGIGFAAKQADLTIIGFSICLIINEINRWINSKHNLKSSPSGYLTLNKRGKIHELDSLITQLHSKFSLTLIRMEENLEESNLSLVTSSPNGLSLSEVKTFIASTENKDFSISFTTNEALEVR